MKLKLELSGKKETKVSAMEMKLRSIPKEMFDETKRLEEIAGVIRKHNLVKNGITPEGLRHVLEDLGPTFIKIGQIMSSRTDVLPKEYCEELEKLRADVKPLPVETIKKEISTELGRPAEELFLSIDEEPLGSASIAQVHAAVLPDGRKVVIKVQRPYVADMMMKDFSLLLKAARMAKISPVNQTVNFEMIIEELKQVSINELDFRIEAETTMEFAENMKDIKYVTCPQIEREYTTQRVLTMSYVDGFSIGNLKKLEEEGYDRKEVATKLVNCFLKQVLDDGLFHADPHQGNLEILNGKICWLDWGMVGRFGKKEQNILKMAVTAVVQKDVNLMKNAVLSLGKPKRPINHPELFNDIDGIMERYCSMNLEDMNIGELLGEIVELASNHGISLPHGFSMLVRALVTIEGDIAKLNVDVNMAQLFSGKVMHDMLEEFDLKQEILGDSKALYESAKKSMTIPSLSADLMKSVIKGQTKVNIEPVGFDSLMKRVEIMVGDMILCIITAAIIVSSSMICTTDMQPKVLDIPLLGFIGYVGAFAMGIYLIIVIHKRRRK
ncbi:MAG: AarF/ABC1/UbiB kinase family protein [Lachnospiraceae bacterium]|nr:AarF/ABC1/UbiB kinase family protein [Lachnospiraceae bacterium]